LHNYSTCTSSQVMKHEHQHKLICQYPDWWKTRTIRSILQNHIVTRLIPIWIIFHDKLFIKITSLPVLRAKLSKNYFNDVFQMLNRSISLHQAVDKETVYKCIHFTGSKQPLIRKNAMSVKRAVATTVSNLDLQEAKPVWSFMTFSDISYHFN